MPTIRQKRVAKIIAEKVGKGMIPNIGAAMREAGYSENVARNPQKLTNTPAFKDLLSQLIPQETVLRAHRGQINARKIITLYVSPQAKKADLEAMVEEIDGKVISKDAPAFGKMAIHISVPHYDAIGKAIDRYYKLTGRYATSKVQIEEHPFANKTEEELDEIIRRGGGALC